MTAEIVHDAINPNAIYSLAELARLVKCSDEHIRTQIKRGKLRGRKNGGRILVFGKDAEEWVKSWPSIVSESLKDSGASPGPTEADAGERGLASALSDRRQTHKQH